MRRVGSIDQVRQVEELLRKHGARERRQTGNRGDYKAMGHDEASRWSQTSLNIPIALGVTLELDERSGTGAIRVKDDNIGRLCNKVPGLLELLGGFSGDGGDNGGGR